MPVTDRQDTPPNLSVSPSVSWEQGGGPGLEETPQGLGCTLLAPLPHTTQGSLCPPHQELPGPVGQLLRTPKPTAGPRLAEPALLTAWPDCRAPPPPPGHLQACPRVLLGCCWRGTLSRTERETEPQGEDVCLKGHRQAEPSWLYYLLDHAQQGMGGPRTPQQSQSSPSHPGKVQDHQTRGTHSHGAPKAAACQSCWEVVDMPAHEGGLT